MPSINTLIQLTAMASLAAATPYSYSTPLATRQDPNDVVAQASLCSDDQFKGGICKFFFLKDGETEHFTDLNRQHGISRITVVPHGSEPYNRQNARYVFRSSIAGAEVCLSSGRSLDEAQLEEIGLNDKLDTVQCFFGRCEGDP